MRFFRLTVSTDERLLQKEKKKRKNKDRAPSFLQNREDIRAYADKVRVADESIAEEKYGRDVFINFSFIDERQAVLIMATNRDTDGILEIQGHFHYYLLRQDYKGDILECEEITGSTYRSLLRDASRNNFIDDYDVTLKHYGFFKHIGSCSYNDFSFEEYIVSAEDFNREEALRQVSEMQTVPSLGEEIERICATRRQKWRPGNPVHYVLAADEGKYRNEYFKLLMKTLYSQKRINCRRFTQLDYEGVCEGYSRDRLNEIYELQRGGAVVFDVRKETIQDSAYLTGKESRAEEVCRLAAKFKNKVLTVFLFPRDSEKLQKTFFLDLDGVSLIRINEGIIFDKEAKAFLRKIAGENDLRSFPGLMGNIEKGAGYTKYDLVRLFDHWYDTHLKEKVFPQYSENAIKMKAADNKTKGLGIERLHELIGLSETKTLLGEILDFATAQKLYSFGEVRSKQSMHMIFSGNPGTAKTTVARLVAQILKENEVLSDGNLIEVGRADLVGKYVGHTAPRVKKQFERASGSVLFIDEAYSLVDDKDGLFGDEAISTIVQEMENCRENVVVIFAGYPDKMEGFLQKNPGLRSRIGFHVNFPDYSPDELCEILELLAKDNRMVLAPGVRERVSPYFQKAAGIREFGNGRYARNLLEKARMKQAARLVRMETGKVTEQIAATLIPEDFEELRLTAMPAEKRVGFV